jgi:hypothetical protein
MQNRNYTELTIVQNGALYAMQHRASKKFRSAHKKKSVASKLSRIDKSRGKVLAGRKIKTEELCFI